MELCADTPPLNPKRKPPSLDEVIGHMEFVHGLPPGELTSFKEALLELPPKERQLLQDFTSAALNVKTAAREEALDKKTLWRSEDRSDQRTRAESLEDARKFAHRIAERAPGRLPLLKAAQKVAEVTDFKKHYQASQPPIPVENVVEAAWSFVDLAGNVGSLMKEFAFTRRHPDDTTADYVILRLNRGAHDTAEARNLRAPTDENPQTLARSLMAWEGRNSSGRERHVINEMRMTPMDLFMHCLPLVASRFNPKRLPKDPQQWGYFAAKLVTSYNMQRYGDPTGPYQLARYPVLSRTLKIGAAVAAASNLWRCLEEVYAGLERKASLTQEYPFSERRVREIYAATHALEEKRKSEGCSERNGGRTREKILATLFPSEEEDDSEDE